MKMKKCRTAKSIDIFKFEISAPKVANLSNGANATLGVAHATLHAVVALTAMNQLCLPAYAAPSGGAVQTGSATIALSAGNMVINSSNGTVIDWKSFSIGKTENVDFIQNNSASAILNRVTGPDPSHLLGTLTSNGNVYLVNSNGIVVGAGAQIDTNGLVLSTLDLSNEDFVTGKQVFSGNADSESIINNGAINVNGGGTAILLGTTIDNNGTIKAENGAVILAAGKEVTLGSGRDPSVKFVVSAPQNEVVNLGNILSTSGRIEIFGTKTKVGGHISVAGPKAGNVQVAGTGSDGAVEVIGEINAASTSGTGGSIVVAGAAIKLSSTAKLDTDGIAGGGSVLLGGEREGAALVITGVDVTHAAAISAETGSLISADAGDAGNGGRVIIWGDNAKVHGSLSARGGTSAGNGGFIETSGHSLDVVEIEIDASAPEGNGGEWLLDPYDIIIQDLTVGSAVNVDSNGTLPTADSSIINTEIIETALNNGTDVTITTSVGGTQAGNVNINNNIEKTAGAGNATLAINADGTITQASGVSISANSGTLGVNFTGKNINIMGDISANGGNINLASMSAGEGGAGLIDAQSANLSTIGSGSIQLNATATTVNDQTAIGLGNSNISVVDGDLSVVAVNDGVGAARVIDLGNTTTIKSSGNGSLKFNATGSTSSSGRTALVRWGASTVVGSTSSDSSGDIIISGYQRGGSSPISYLAQVGPSGASSHIYHSGTGNISVSMIAGENATFGNNVQLLGVRTHRPVNFHHYGSGNISMTVDASQTTSPIHGLYGGGLRFASDTIISTNTGSIYLSSIIPDSSTAPTMSLTTSGTQIISTSGDISLQAQVSTENGNLTGPMVLGELDLSAASGTIELNVSGIVSSVGAGRVGGNVTPSINAQNIKIDIGDSSTSLTDSASAPNSLATASFSQALLNSLTADSLSVESGPNGSLSVSANDISGISNVSVGAANLSVNSTSLAAQGLTITGTNVSLTGNITASDELSVFGNDVSSSANIQSPSLLIRSAGAISIEGGSLPAGSTLIGDVTFTGSVELPVSKLSIENDENAAVSTPAAIANSISSSLDGLPRVSTEAILDGALVSGRPEETSDVRRRRRDL